MSDARLITPDCIRSFKIRCQPVTLCQDLTDEELLECILDVEELIECITNQKFCPERRKHEFNGTGTECLFFDGATDLPLHTLVRVTAKRNGTEEELTGFTKHGHYLEYCCNVCESSSSSCGCCPDSCCGFPEGCSNICVDGYWGKDAPREIKRAAKLLVLEKLLPGSTGLGGQTGCDNVEGLLVSKVQWPDYSVTYAQPENAAELLINENSTGFFQIDQILKRHTNHSCVFMVV